MKCTKIYRGHIRNLVSTEISSQLLSIWRFNCTYIFMQYHLIPYIWSKYRKTCSKFSLFLTAFSSIDNSKVKPSDILEVKSVKPLVMLIGIPLIGLTMQNCCACSKTGPGFPMTCCSLSYVQLSEARGIFYFFILVELLTISV